MRRSPTSNWATTSASPMLTIPSPFTSPQGTLATVVVVAELLVVVVRNVIVVVEVVVVVVEVVSAGWKVASTMYQLVAVPKVRLPSCGPAALDRMSSRVEAALPFCASRRYGTIWLLPGSAQPGRPPVRTAATTSSPAGARAVRTPVA